MATRMQQRRGTAAQWTAANPILAAGEIGFETDTSKFKMGNGSSNWASLQYFANAAELTNIIDGAPDLLNTLNELAAAMGDNPDFLTLYATIELTEEAIAESRSDAAADATAKANAVAAAASLDATGKAATAKAEAITEAGTNAATGIANHQALTTDVHGIANTALLATMEYADDAQAAAEQHADEAVAAAVLALTPETIGLENVDNTTDANKPVSTAQATAISTAVSDHNAETENVHGIADTSELVTQTQLTNALSGATVDQSALAGVGLEWNAGTDKFDIDETHITTSTQSALDLKAPLADPTFTGTVSGVTKTHVGLANVDNTSDANKPVSTATQTALDAKAPIAAPSFTGNANFESNVTIEGNLLVEGTTTTVNTSEVQIDDPIFYLSANQYDTNTRDIGITGAYGTVGGTEANHLHTGLVKDVTDGKWKLFSNTPHPVNNVVDFTSAQYDTLKVGPLEATTVNASSGIVFSDGTQTKLGVPSVTTFATAISSSATLAAGEADKFVPLTGAVTITLPATGYSTGQSIDFYQASGTGAQFSSANSTVGTPGLKFRTTNSVVTAMKTAAGWLVFGDLSL
jgi:trimeric autotransporter adhesin